MLDPRGGLAGAVAQTAAPPPGTGAGPTPSRRVLRAAADAVALARSDWSRAPQAVARLSRGKLGSRERRMASDLVWQVVRARRLLERLVGEAPEDLVRAAAVLYLDAPPDIASEAHREPLSDPAHQLLGDVLMHGADATAVFGCALSLPDWFAERLLAEHPLDHAIALGRSLLERAPLTLRAHRERMDRDALIAALAADGVRGSPSPVAPDAVVLSGHVNVHELGPVQRGEASVQDAGSQAVAALLQPADGERLLDACAGAGGKTLALASLAPGARVLGADVREPALQEAARRARLAGVADRVRFMSIPPEGSLPEALARTGFDAILIDAPCTGSGALRREPQARWSRSPLELQRMPALQRQILERFAPLLRPGGRLVYATCSLFAAENEEVVQAFLAAHPAFHCAETLRLRPDRDGCDGFYAARLELTR